jgi:PTH2 family peptidyl-tRNA hydrolase
MSDPNEPVLYIVVRKELGLSTGKTAAQCCHALQYILQRYYTNTPSLSKQQKQVMQEWMESAHAKVVLAASEVEWQALLDEGLADATVRDAGRTEIDPGTITCAALFPVRKSNAPKLIKGLPLLK